MRCFIYVYDIFVVDIFYEILRKHRCFLASHFFFTVHIRFAEN